MSTNKLLDAPIEGALLLASLIWIAMGTMASQSLLEIHRWYAYTVMAFGAVGFLASAYWIRREQRPAGFSGLLEKLSARLGGAQAQWIYLSASLLLIPLAMMASGTERNMISPGLAVGSWIIASILIVLTFIDPQDIWPKLTRQDWLYMLVFFVLTIGLHIVNLENIPNTFQGDEGSVGNSAVNFINGFQNNIFGVGWFSFPGLYFWVHGQFIRVLGQTIFAARLPSVLISGFISSVTYLIGKKMFNQNVGLFAGIFITGFHYFNHFSRLALNNIWDAFWVPVALFAVWYGFERENSLGFTLGGVALGLAQYFYVSSRLLFALIPVWLVFAILLKRQKFGPNLRNIVGFVLVSLVVMAPLNYYFSQHPDEYAAPLNRVRVDQEWLTHEVEIRQEPASKIVSELFLNSVKIIVIGGSGNFFYDSGTPVLRMAEAAIFMIGFLFLFLKPRDNRHWLLFLWLFFFTVSGALSLPNPSVHRYVALCVCFALVFAIGLDELQALFSQVWKDKVRWIFIAALAVSVLVAMDDIRFYLFDYAPRGALGGVNTLLADRVARYVIDNYDSDDDLQLAFLNTPRMGYSSIMALPFLTPDFEGFDYPHEVGSPDNPQLTADQVMFIVLPEREAELQTLKDMYPGGTLVTRIFEENQDILFWLYIVDLN